MKGYERDPAGGPVLSGLVPDPGQVRWRWLAVAVFILSSTLNYIDRQMLAVLAPLIMAELHFNLTRFGIVLSAFSLTYAASSLGAGWFLDRAGVNRGISASVGWWSAAALGTGTVTGFGGLLAFRMALGAGESAGVPAVGKLNGMYLKPEERALGAALNQVGLSAGSALAPLWIALAYAYSWRFPFILAGALGFVWIPAWLALSRVIRPGFASKRGSEAEAGAPGFRLLLNRKLLILMAANVLWMGAYSIWSNWTTIYLTRVYHITLRQSGYLVWIPQIVSILGGFAGGWYSAQRMRRGDAAVNARRRAIGWAAAGMLSTVLLLWMPDAISATTVISLSFFFALAGSVNIYALPIDLFGAARSGLAIAALGFGYGILQVFISPLIGFFGDHNLYKPVIWIAAIPPAASAVLLERLRERE